MFYHTELTLNLRFSNIAPNINFSSFFQFGYHKTDEKVPYLLYTPSVWLHSTFVLNLNYINFVVVVTCPTNSLTYYPIRNEGVSNNNTPPNTTNTNTLPNLLLRS